MAKSVTCGNCKEAAVVLSKDTIYCRKCKELFTVDGEKQTPVKDKAAVVANLSERTSAAKALVVELAELAGVELEPESESVLPFIPE